MERGRGAGHRLPPPLMGSGSVLTPEGTVPSRRARPGAVPPGTAPCSPARLGAGPGSPRDRPRLPRGKPVGTVAGQREVEHPVGAHGTARPPGRVAGGRREVTGRTAGPRWRRGTGGRDRNAGPSTRAGLMSPCLTPSTEPRGWVHGPVPRLHSRLGEAFPARDAALPGDPGAAAADAPREWERSAAGPVRAPGWASGAERRRRAEKERGRRGLLQCCNAAPRRARRPGRAPPPVTAAMRMEAPPGLGRTGPAIPRLLGPRPAPGAPGCRSAPLPRPRFVFLPPLPGPRDVSSRGGTQPACVPGIALCLGARRDPHPECRRTPPAATLGAPPAPRLLSASPLDAGSCEAPGAAPAGADPWSLPGSVPASPGRFSFLPAYPPGPQGLCVSISPPCPRCPLCTVQQQTALRGPGRGGGPTSAPLPRQTPGTAAPRPLVGAPPRTERLPGRFPAKPPLIAAPPVAEPLAGRGPSTPTQDPRPVGNPRSQRAVLSPRLAAGAHGHGGLLVPAPESPPALRPDLPALGTWHQRPFPATGTAGGEGGGTGQRQQERKRSSI
ncbi:collagen alpha-1(I) chain-like [Ammospiza nelsoni]|uniref:collagen alpha-1(I) chain-like n=1 Tax=Ammospiza nelsoni TaxID=2857394 RepID=UPI002869E666|nr:collagen alpha-1(I) chain-like [Ammospiza nelsoni]